MLENKKVHVGKHSREIQEKAFELGYEWQCGDKTVRNLDKPFLYFDDKGRITCGVDVDYFDVHEYEEITAAEILATKVVKPKNGENKLTCFQEKFETYAQLSKREAMAYYYLPTLLLWRNKYNDGWRAEWSNPDESKYCIQVYEGRLETCIAHRISHLFTFRTEEIRDKFFEKFKKELEIVKPLL